MDRVAGIWIELRIVEEPQLQVEWYKGRSLREQRDAKLKTPHGVLAFTEYEPEWKKLAARVWVPVEVADSTVAHEGVHAFVQAKARGWRPTEEGEATAMGEWVKWVRSMLP